MVGNSRTLSVCALRKVDTWTVKLLKLATYEYLKLATNLYIMCVLQCPKLNYLVSIK